LVYDSNRQNIRLVITDTMMPVMGGLQMVRLLRAQAPALPIISMTGLEQESKRQEYTSLGVAAMLLKPCDPAQLMEAVRLALDRPVPPV
jgi:CheY-like chemotaxis protein